MTPTPARRHKIKKTSMSRQEPTWNKRQKTAGYDLFSLLASDVRIHVLSFLIADDLAELAQVSKGFQEDCRDSRLPQNRTVVVRVVDGSCDSFFQCLWRLAERGISKQV